MNYFTLMLNPALALVSMNITPHSRALDSPSSVETCLMRTDYSYSFGHVQRKMW